MWLPPMGPPCFKDEVASLHIILLATQNIRDTLFIPEKDKEPVPETPNILTALTPMLGLVTYTSSHPMPSYILGLEQHPS